MAGDRKPDGRPTGRKPLSPRLVRRTKGELPAGPEGAEGLVHVKEAAQPDPGQPPGPLVRSVAVVTHAAANAVWKAPAVCLSAAAMLTTIRPSSTKRHCGPGRRCFRDRNGVTTCGCSAAGLAAAGGRYPTAPVPSLSAAVRQ